MASPEGNPTTVIPSPSFAIICASLALNSITNTILLSHAPGDTHTHCLPQGPKRLDEGLVYAAVRHTRDMTNTAVEPLRLRIPTRAGLWRYGDGHSSPRDESEVVGNLVNSEPFAVCVGSGGGVSRIVFYFLAMAKKEKGEGEEHGEEQGGEEGVWVKVEDVEEGRAGVSEEEKMVIKMGVELAKKDGFIS